MLHHMFIFDQSCTLKVFKEQKKKRESFWGREDGVEEWKEDLEITLCR